MAAQLIFDERLYGLVLMCRARATSSLPVPLSPVISTVDGVSATLSIIARSTAAARPRCQSSGSVEVARQVAAAGIAALSFLIELEARQRFCAPLAG